MQERDRDRDALAHAAGELVRIGVEPLLGRGDADARERLAGRGRAPPFADTLSCARIASIICVSMRRTGFSVFIGSWKIIARRWPRKARSSSSGLPSKFLAVEPDRAARDPPRRVDEAEDGEPGDRFARPGFADEPQHLAAA